MEETEQPSTPKVNPVGSFILFFVVIGILYFAGFRYNTFLYRARVVTDVNYNLKRYLPATPDDLREFANDPCVLPEWEYQCNSVRFLDDNNSSCIITYSIKGHDYQTQLDFIHYTNSNE